MNKKQLKQYILEDFYRYFGTYDKKMYYRYSFTYPNIAFTKSLRLAKYYKDKNKIKYLWYKILHRRMTTKYGFQIPIETEIGRGFYLGHHGSVVINVSSKIGNNVNIGQCVTIGQTNRGPKQGCPTIGNNVFVGPNSVVVGKITIGDNVLIAPLAYVNIDVPSNSIVLGNPARIIPRNNATEKYIQNEIVGIN